MRDGLYKVYFETPLGANFGVVHAVDGKIWGGDSSMFYVGSYVTRGNEITAHVALTKFLLDLLPDLSDISACETDLAA
jgi:hypothetical protein